MKFQVVTRVPDPFDAKAAAGNAALVLPLYVDLKQDGNLEILRATDGALNFRGPVFHLGEVMIVEDTGGREVVGRGRKASKWDVNVETYDTVEEAVARAWEVAERDLTYGEDRPDPEDDA